MNTWLLSALWVVLALIATLIAIWFRMPTALSEIVVGTVAQLVIGAAFAHGGLLGNTAWITYLAGTGAIVPTFLAGAERCWSSPKPLEWANDSSKILYRLEESCPNRARRMR